MPRKAAQRKDAAGAATKSSKAASSRKASRAITKDEEDESQAAERSCRSSTAAQTAASAAESRGARSKPTKKGASSPSRESSKTTESSASRVRSSRKSSQHVNYKESDGEEDAPAPKNEDDFESNEEFDESDSDEKNKKKSKKARSVPKGRAAKPKSRGAPKGRRGKKKKVSEDEDEDEEEETVELSDESEREKDAPKEMTESKKEEKVSPRARKSRTASAAHPVIDIADSEEKPGRRSRRASSQSTPVEPVCKRPSRNRQVKKYTEVDEEDFSAKSEEEYEPEVKKEASSKKRKRDSDIGSSNKRAKGDKSADKSGDDCDAEDKKLADDIEGSECKTGDDTEEQQSDEPMEIDESVPDEAQSPSEDKKESTDEKKKGENAKKEDIPSKETAQQKSEKNKESSSKPVKPGSEEKGAKFEERGKVADAPATEVEKDNIDHGGAAKQESHPKSSDPAVAKGEEKTEMKSSAIEQSNQETKKSDSENTAVQSHDDTFPSKEPAPSSAASVNGDDNRSSADSVAPKDIPLSSETSAFQRQNNMAPKTNGAQNELVEKKTIAQEQVFILPNRKHVFNQCISEDLRSSLKQGTFGIVSYNLSSPFINAEKLIHELDKLQASIICLQEVSRSFFNETLESKLDALGYKAIFNTPWSDSGLVTFYKSSLFRLCNVVDTPTSGLISEALESSRLEESEEQAIFGCYDKCGNVLIIQLKSVLSSHGVTVANIRIPPCSLSLNALQVCCVVRKISTMREHIKPVLICGEFNSCETEVPYQLVKSGYLSERMIEELKNKTDGAECIPLIKLLQSKSGVLSCAMFSCYNLVLGKDIGPPKSNIARDVLWASADNLHIIGVLDACTDPSDSKTDYRVSLKADIGFFV